MRVSDLVPGNASAEIRALAAKAVTFKFTNLVQLIRHDIGGTGGDATKLYLVPFVRFILLKAQAEDVDAKLLSPTENIDRVWHLMLQFPAEYAVLCDLLLPATQKKRIIDHKPLAAYTASGARTKRLQTMLAAYEREFGDRAADSAEVAAEAVESKKPKIVRRTIKRCGPRKSCGSRRVFKPGHKC